MYNKVLRLGLLVLAAAMVATAASASQISGAIFTTVSDGSFVNYNIYPSKDAVYLDGGPGPGAPQTAAGLPDGDYVFQVTDPSGKTLLSQDIAACRRFTVANGIIVALVTSNPTCPAPHITGIDIDHGALTIQLMPYADTPNNGGEYKAWATPVVDFTCPLTSVDCPNDKHGFIPSFSKTDNFKAKLSNIREIDTVFQDTNNNNAPILGIGETWIDTLGASNNKWSYYDPQHDVQHNAHIEAPEDGTHQIVITDQPGCTVDDISIGIGYSLQHLPNRGPQTVLIKMSPNYKNVSIFVYVNCN